MHARSIDSWSRWNKAVKSERKDPVKQTRAPDVFDGILYSGLPEDEKSVDRLSQDGFLAITAGGDPIARTMAIGTYYLLTNPEDLKLLRAELDTVMPDRNKLPELAKLEALPFLVCHLCLRSGVDIQGPPIANRTNRQLLLKRRSALLVWRLPGCL